MPSKRSLSPLYVAKVNQTAGEATTKAGLRVDKSKNPHFARLKKCLNTTEATGATENEAKVAIHMASKLMAQLNMTLADVLAYESPEERQQHAGQSVVALTRCDGDRKKSVQEASWLDQLSYAMRLFFDCKSFTESGKSDFKITFYGIGANTVAAANGFCMVYNLARIWCREHKGRTAQNSYCEGVAVELQRTAKNEKAQEEVYAKEAEAQEIRNRLEREEAQRTAEIERLAEIVSVSEEESREVIDISDEEPDSDMPFADFQEADEEGYDGTTDLPDIEFDAHIKKVAAAMDKKPQPEDAEDKNDERSLWSSHQQVVVFRKTAMEIADQCLDSLDFKLYAGRKRKPTNHDQRAFNQGRIDSKKIDVREKMLLTEGDPMKMARE